MAKQPLVSVIVPTFNSSLFLEDCLKSIKDQSYFDIELVVVDNHSSDSTLAIAKKFNAIILTRGPERSAQRNFGVKHAHGQYLLIIDSDMVLSRDVVEQCVKTMFKHTDSKALVVPEESFGQGFWAQCKKLERSFYIGVEWMEAARFFDRRTFDECNGYDESNTGTEDFDLPQRIEQKYGRKSIGRVSALIYHNERRLSLFATCNKKYYYAQKLQQYTSVSANKAKFAKQSSITQRYLLFFRDPAKLLRNPIIGAGMLFMKTSEFTAGVLGYITAKITSAKGGRAD